MPLHVKLLEGKLKFTQAYKITVQMSSLPVAPANCRARQYRAPHPDLEMNIDLMNITMKQSL